MEKYEESSSRTIELNFSRSRKFDDANRTSKGLVKRALKSFEGARFK